MSPRLKHLPSPRRCLPFSSAGPLAWALWPWISPERGTKPPRPIIFYGLDSREVSNEAIFPAFVKKWQEDGGDPIRSWLLCRLGAVTARSSWACRRSSPCFRSTRGRLVDAGVVPAGSWRSLPTRASSTALPSSFSSGRAIQNIRDFDDLARPGIRRARRPDLGRRGWAILAEYGAAAPAPGGSAEMVNACSPESEERHRPGSLGTPRERSLTNGFGDALIAYEQEALADGAGRLHAEIYPRRTVFSEHTLVVWTQYRRGRPPGRLRPRALSSARRRRSSCPARTASVEERGTRSRLREDRTTLLRGGFWRVGASEARGSWMGSGRIGS